MIYESSKNTIEAAVKRSYPLNLLKSLLLSLFRVEKEIVMKEKMR